MPIIILFIEIAMVYWFIKIFGFLNFFLFYIVTMICGIIFVKKIGTKALRQFQTGQVTAPNRNLISKGLLFLSGLLLIVPSMGAKVIGGLMILPPVRWVLSAVFAGFLLKRVFGANSFVHQFGSGGFQFYYQSQGSPFQKGPFYDQSHIENDPNQDINAAGSGEVIDAEFRKVEDPKLLK